jgi:hypothetical protein
MVPMYIKEVPAFHTEGALKEWVVVGILLYVEIA